MIWSNLEALVEFATRRAERWVYDGLVTARAQAMLDRCTHTFWINPDITAILIYTRDTTRQDRRHDGAARMARERERSDLMAKEPSCRVCGCTQNNACFDEKRGHGCHWAARGLCNVCAEKAKAIKLSDAQRRHIALLALAGAYSRLRARWTPDLVPSVIGRLIRSELAASAVIRKHRAQRTVYWLTPLGREVARRKAS